MNFAKLTERKLLLLCGSGGVGKTTLSAAIAVRAAMEGKRVGLITVDPARRLATSLGLEDLPSDPKDITKNIERETGIKPKGSLSALMLDSNETLNRFLLNVGGEEVQKKFLESNLYQVIADNFSGTHDYLALEKLFELHQSGKFDLILLDTPPARHTLDFLDAPDRIARFFDDRIFVWFLTDPRNQSWREKIRAKGTKTALGLLEKITGAGVLHDFTVLAPYFLQVKNAFVERQNTMLKVITSDEAGAFFITSPQDLNRGEAVPFVKETKRHGVALLALVVNRSLQHLAAQPAPKNPGQTPRFLWDNYQNIRYLVEEEEKNFAALNGLAGGSAVCFPVPELRSDIHDLKGLHQVSQYF
jgi:anion-transporting  ArsA/GET3 family ATPase